MIVLDLTSMSKVVAEIRPVCETDLSVLAARFFQGGTAKHGERYARQQKGEVVYLVAFCEGQPVGHALLKWHGSQDTHVVNHLKFACPDIEDVFVLAELRSQGIGSQLLSFAEQLVIDHGYAHMGLSVAETNESARCLYERLGYKDARFGEYIEQGESIDAQGQLQRWMEICFYLIKDLEANDM
jgi:GNAT superfamily N-acetyltransferase